MMDHRGGEKLCLSQKSALNNDIYNGRCATFILAA